VDVRATDTRRMQLHTVFPIAFLLLVGNACEPSPFPDDIDELAARWADARVSFEQRCITPHSLNGSFARDAEPTLASTAPPPPSRAEIDAEFRRGFLVPDRQLDRDAFARCVGTLEGLPACPVAPDVLFARAGCTQLFAGAREAGDGCATDDVCAPGLFCDAPPLSCGVCGTDLRGDDSFRPCDDDPMCGIFEAPTEVGAACELNCGSGLYPALACIDGRCVQRRVIGFGGTCDSVVENPFEPRSLRHCRDEDFGASTCLPAPSSELDGVCVATIRDVSPGAFVPGAQVVSSAVGGGATGVLLECAP
jgi:hypothetical protein